MASDGFPAGGYTLSATIGRSGSNITVSAPQVTKAAGWTGRYSGDERFPWSISVTGGSGANGTWGYDFRGNTNGTVTRQVTGAKSFSRPPGTYTVTVTVAMDNGTAQIKQTVTIPNPATVPPAPSNLGVDSATTTSLRYRFKSNGNGGSSIIRWEYQRSTSPTFSSGNGPVTTSTGTSTATGLTPGTKYYFRSRGVNAVGNGPWSATATGSTLPAVAPGMVVTPAAVGTSTKVVMSPPGGVTGVTSYEVEYTLVGGATKTSVGTSSTRTISGLVPGKSYSWRSRAKIGDYTSPWTAAQVVTQPNPNTSPGDYFDGSSAARDDVSFSWAGTANASQSIASGRGVTGWHIISSAGASAVLQQVAGGYRGAHCARMLFKTGTTGTDAGLGAGSTSPTRAAVVPGALYVGSIYVRPSRAQRLRVYIHWFNEAGGETSLVDRATGEAQIVPADEWTRLTVTGNAPTDAAYASVYVRDSPGEGRVAWERNDTLDADAAMLTLGSLFPYFDGSTGDTIEFRYDWLGTAHASESTRTTLVIPEVNPLQDPDCDPMPLPPQPPEIPADCIEEVGTWRRSRIQIPDGEVRLWASTLPTFILTTYGAAERQVRIRLYPNPNGLAPELIDTNSWDAELILSYIPANTVIVLDSVDKRVYASVNGGRSQSAHHLLYGSNGQPAEWPEFQCGVGYVATLDVPTENPDNNLQVRVTLTEGM